MSATPVDLSRGESWEVVRHVLGPIVAQGPIVRRPRVTAWAERRQIDRQVADALDSLRDRHDGAPLVLRIGPRTVVLVTEPEDVARLLDGSPEPFTPASREKRGALRQFQPDGVLISRTSDRQYRRPLNERALGHRSPVPGVGGQIVQQVTRTAAELSEMVHRHGLLDSDRFSDAWWELVRVVTFGEHARDDRLLVERLAALRRAGNWSYLRPVRTRLREAFSRQVSQHVADAEPGALAAEARSSAESLGSAVRRAVDDVAGQVPHWLFAFDAAGIAILRALAISAERPQVRDRLAAELATELATAGHGAAVLPYGRACVLESVRLWPTTLVVLRDSTEPTTWGARMLPAGTGFAIVSGFAHRDRRRIDFADAFTPEAWLDGRADADRALVPFSAGPAECAGRDLVLFATSHLLSRLSALGLAVDRGEHLARDPLPATVDHFGLRFRLPERARLGGVVVGEDSQVAAGD